MVETVNSINCYRDPVSTRDIFKQYHLSSSQLICSEGQPGVTILSLPLEILDTILGIVIQDLVEQMNGHFMPAKVLAKYRAINLACKSFFYILANSPKTFTFRRGRKEDQNWLKFVIQETMDTSQSMDEPDDETLLCKGWSELFQAYQKLSFKDCGPVVTPPWWNIDMGKFWCNPTITVHNLVNYAPCCWGSNEQLLLILGDILSRNPRRLTGRQKNVINIHYPILPYRRGRLMSSLDWYNNVYVFSVKSWMMPRNARMRSSKIAPEVQEWWISHSLDEEGNFSGYISGYRGCKAWVFNAKDLKLFTNFDPRSTADGRSIIKKAPNFAFQEYWEEVLR